MLSAYFTASSLGNATASTPAFNAKASVSLRIVPLGLMHPKINGVSGNISRATEATLAMSSGFGGGVFAMAVPWMGMNPIITKAEGLTLLII